MPSAEESVGAVDGIVVFVAGGFVAVTFRDEAVPQGPMLYVREPDLHLCEYRFYCCFFE